MNKLRIQDDLTRKKEQALKTFGRQAEGSLFKAEINYIKQDLVNQNIQKKKRHDIMMKHTVMAKQQKD